MELRPYQAAAVAAIERELQRVRSTLLVLPTGAGKTHTFGAVARGFADRGQRVLVLAHRAELLDQAANVLARFGLTTGIEQAGACVDPAALPAVVIASVATLQGRRLAAFAPDAFGLLIVDEAHHAIAPTWRAVLEHFAPAKVLGVSATPDRFDGVGLRHVFESVAYRMELSEGIEGGYLAPIELRSVVVDALDLSKVRTVAGDLHGGELERELMRDGVLHAIACPLAELAAGRQTLAFVAGVAQAHALSEVLRGYGVAAAAVDGAMPAARRAELLADYRAGRIQVVANAQLWTEGFDEPSTSCIALVRPTRSRALLAQQIGRGSRLAPGKRECLLLDFVPGRAHRIRLAGPADVLAGADLPAEIAARVRSASVEQSGDVLTLIETATEDQAAAERLAAEEQQRQHDEHIRRIQSVGVIYDAPHMPVADLLAAECDEPPGWRPEWRRRLASDAQITALEKLGFDVPPDLDHKQAKALFDLCKKRRVAGLCTIKQARVLRGHGLRDDVSFELAGAAIDAISRNGWRPPSRLYSDPRFARPKPMAG